MAFDSRTTVWCWEWMCDARCMPCAALFDRLVLPGCGFNSGAGGGISVFPEFAGTLPMPDFSIHAIPGMGDGSVVHI